MGKSRFSKSHDWVQVKQSLQFETSRPIEDSLAVQFSGSIFKNPRVNVQECLQIENYASNKPINLFSKELLANMLG